MLALAKLHEGKLIPLLNGILFKEKYKFFTPASYGTTYTTMNGCIGWDDFQYVSLDSSGEIIGYISCEFTRDCNKLSGLCIANFTDNKITFGRDLHNLLDTLLSRPDVVKLTYSVIVGNPIESSYDIMTAKYGGRIVGTYKKHVKLFDGYLYDSKAYEIMSADYLKFKFRKQEK